MILLDTHVMIVDALASERLIAATARHHAARLVTADERLRGLSGVAVVW